MSDDLKIIERLESQIDTPWSKTGEQPQEYVLRVTESIQQVSDLLSARTSDTSMVQSAIKDTADLVLYATTRKELLALKSLMLSHLARENRHGNNDTEGPN